MKKFTPQEESKEISKLFQQKPEIDQKVAYYKGVIYSTNNLINSIDELIKRGYKLEKGSWLFPFSKKIMLDVYDVSKLEIEKLEAGYKLEAQKNYFEMALERSAEYDKKFAILSAECEARFDEIMHFAKQVASYNIRLASVIDKYDNKDNNQKLRVEYYLYLKQEVENSQQFSKRKLEPLAPVDSVEEQKVESKMEAVK